MGENVPTAESRHSATATARRRGSRSGAAPPAYVYAIVVSLFAFFNVFALKGPPPTAIIRPQILQLSGY